MDGSLKLQECLKMRVVALASLLLLEDVCPQNIQQFLYVLPRVFSAEIVNIQSRAVDGISLLPVLLKSWRE